MPRYSIEFHPAALRDLRQLTRQIQAQIAPVIDALADEPPLSGVVKLHGAENLYRVRSGDYRILYEIRDSALIVVVVKIGNRREVYR
jgi:mRNA interferase RelE/StbE